MRLYHATTRDKLASIIARGLDPAFSQEPADRDRYIYLAADLFHAASYVESSVERVILSVSTTDLDEAALGPDDVDLDDIVSSDPKRFGYRDWDVVALAFGGIGMFSLYELIVRTQKQPRAFFVYDIDKETMGSLKSHLESMTPLYRELGWTLRGCDDSHVYYEM